MKKLKHSSWGSRPGALVLAAACACSLTACGSSTEDAVSVQSVSMLLGLDVSGVNAYTGVVESKNVQKVARDSNKTVDQRFVEVGDQVEAGDPLFSYDVDALQLSLDSAQLEIDQLKNSITNYDTQIAQLEKEKKAAAKSEQLSYTLQIQTAQKDQAEAQYNLKVKEAELEKLEASMENTQVCAELSGVVQAISEDDPAAYITIQETDTYQIKGTANELNVSELYVGEEVVVRSRVNDDVWYGTVSNIETGSTADDSSNDNYYYDSGSSGESASKYNFYVELDGSDDLLMGQHVYIEPNLGGDGDGLWLPSGYIVNEDDGSAYVWGADSKDKLAKLSLELGEYDAELDSYEILSGLTGADYIAFPEDGFSVGQSVVKYDDSYFAMDGDMDYDFDGSDDWSEDGDDWSEDGEYSDEGYYYTDENDVEHYVDADGMDYVVAEDGSLTEAQ
jgi:HlyD family secretion protein